jgi:diguanylate cyclase (GGDEF)-like protein/PAS domain S-box-containing protein
MQIARQNRVLEERNYELEQNAQSLAQINTLLEQASKRFQELFQGLPVACFCYDAQGCIYEWNRACEALFGLRAHEVFQKKIWETIGRPQDWEITQALVASVFAGDTYEGLEWEHPHPDGATRHLLCNTFPLRGPGNAIVGGISASLDITERRQAQEALWESEERWQLALRGNNDGIWDWNLKTGTIFFSPRWKQILGYEKYEIANTLQERTRRVHPDDHERVEQAIKDHFNKKTEFYSTEHRVLCKDGAYKWILDRGQALWNRNGEVIRMAGSSTDITERKRQEQQILEQQRELEAANARLEALATLDGLTGLKNHRAFQERLEREWERALRYNAPLSLLFLDVDMFKDYNDAYGHPAGDQVLKTVAHLLQQHARDTDFVARYGGEEFVVVLPHTDCAGARTVAERLRSAIAAVPWPQRPVTASFGAATRTRAMRSRDALITHADRALYRSKQSGRDRVSHAVDFIQNAITEPAGEKT